MAVTSSGWVSIVGGTDTGADVEAKLDTAFTNIDSALVVNDANEAAIATMTTAVSVVTTSPLIAQTLVADTPEKLEWMTTKLVDSGNGSISATVSTNNIVILATGIYKMYGVVNALIPANDEASIELYLNGNPTGFKSSLTGKGATAVTFVYNFMNNFSVNDDLTLYVTSSGTSITVQNASVTVEKTPYV